MANSMLNNNRSNGKKEYEIGMAFFAPVTFAAGCGINPGPVLTENIRADGRFHPGRFDQQARANPYG